MTIETRIIFKDFLIFNLKNSLIRIIVFPIIALIFFGINYYDADDTNRDFLESTALWLLIFFIFIIIRTYFSVRKTFFSNTMIQETIFYTFTNGYMYSEGETFDAEVGWESVYKIKEKRDWFLIYQNAQVMNMVPKKFFSKDQITELRNIIKNNKVRSTLRND